MPVLKDADDVRLGADGASRVYLGADEVWSAVTIVEHGSDAEFPRPAVNTVHWFGSVMPDNGQTSDVWFMVRPHLPEPNPWDYDATIGGGVWVRRSDGELGYPGPEMRFTVSTTGPTSDLLVIVPLRDTVSVDIDWGDGTVDIGITSNNPSHTYAADGSYDIVVSGSAGGFGLTGLPALSALRRSPRRITEFRALGRLGLTSITGAFRFTDQMSTFYGDAWDVSDVTEIDRTFQEATAFNYPIAAWDVSSVTTTRSTFEDASAFNQPIGAWNLSNNLTEARRMFRSAEAFNQPIGDWDISNVGNGSDMFRNADAFQQPLNSWTFTGTVNIADFMRGKTGGDSYNTPDYNALLIRWNELVTAGTLSNNRVTDMGGAQHSGAGTTARNSLIAAGWSITDGGAA